MHWLYKFQLPKKWTSSGANLPCLSVCLLYFASKTRPLTTLVHRHSTQLPILHTGCLIGYWDKWMACIFLTESDKRSFVKIIHCQCIHVHVCHTHHEINGGCSQQLLSKLWWIILCACLWATKCEDPFPKARLATHLCLHVVPNKWMYPPYHVTMYKQGLPLQWYH